MAKRVSVDSDLAHAEDGPRMSIGERQVTATAFTTGTSTATVLNPLQGGDPLVVVQSGQNFDCSNWTEDSGASITAPNVNMDVEIPILGMRDIAQGIRYNDD